MIPRLHRRTRGRRSARVTCLAAILSITMPLTACTGSDSDDNPVPTGGGDGEVIFNTEDQATPTTTAEQVPVNDRDVDDRVPATIINMFSWRLATDDSPADAIERNRKYYTDSWADETKDRWSGLTAVTSQQWAEWREQGAADTRVTVEEDADERPADSDEATYRAYMVKQRFVTDNGAIVSNRSFHIFTVSTLEDGVWKIAHLTIQEKSR